MPPRKRPQPWVLAVWFMRLLFLVLAVNALWLWLGKDGSLLQHAFYTSASKKAVGRQRISANRTSRLPIFNNCCRGQTDRLSIALQKMNGSRWRFNKTAIDIFRRDLLEISHFHEYFTATKKNSPLNSFMYFFEKNKKVRIPVSGPVWFRLPKELPFSKDDRFNTCAVVGNSGILKNSKCSDRIDSSDLVIRCNFAPVDGNYTGDVGRKTGVMTLNPSILIHTYKWLLMRRDQDRFLRDMGHYGNALVYTNPFHFREVTDIVIKADLLARHRHARQKLYFSHPTYLEGVTEFWRRRNVTERRLSTGLFLTSAAIALCSQVQLYGFWPFSTDRHGNNIPYHYYDKSSINSVVHNISEEFGHLLQLYREGIVNITTHPCETNLNSSISA
ncbi:alpha-N-acetylneuraminide alpha-2,8-sialyltransferase-like [Branchiostoma floridae]|uniref:Alpha-N-acetylneuraminide alpha-2,8-sialyltransferase-like n=2 Tax=Branchiostoma floridae TaxID=7739 RepID=A0A9J7KT90_BRAFL|nr:alpha-N-acetylneuraminide alpha-2,8-sialyltransferase-like [Branchiostoma floridae]